MSNKLPAQVQRQVDAVAAIEAAMHGTPENTGTPSQPDQPSVDTNAPPLPTSEAPPVSNEPAQAPARQAQPEFRVEDDPKFKVLQGKYNAEVPRLHQQTNDLQHRVNAQAAEIEALRRQTTTPEKKDEPSISDKDVSDFGADMIDLIRRVSGELFKSTFMPQVQSLGASLESRISAIEGVASSVAGRQKMTDEERFYATLTQAVPNWEEINKSSQWLAWLAEEDPVIGGTLQDVINAACASLDSKRAIAVFQKYIGTQKQPEPVAPRAPAPTQQVSPSRAASTPPTAAAEKGIWTDAAIKAFYHDVSMGKFKGKEALQEQIELDLNAAYSDGRYRQR